MSPPMDKLQAIAAALDLCQQCEHQLTGKEIDTPPATPARGQLDDDCEDYHRPVNDISYRKCILTDVRIADCDMQAFTAKNCDFENVTFRMCNFSNVVFDGMKLQNVACYNVDFQNVHFNTVDLSDATWMEEGLRNAYIHGDAFEHVSGAKTTVALRTKDETQLSRITWFEPPKVRSDAFDEEENREKRYINVISKPQTGIFEVPKIRSKIMDYLFPCPRRMHGSTMVMVDRPAFEPGKISAQTQYRTKSPFGFGSPAQTYHGWCRPLMDGVRQGLTPLNFCTALLLANKQCYGLAVPYIYDRGFIFESAERCLAFLHDHQKAEHQLSGLSLKYSSLTNPAAWRRLFNVIVHERRDVREFVLDIGVEFWDTAQSRRPAKEAVNWPGWSNLWTLDNPADGQRTFLQHVARLPGRRLSAKKVEAPRKAEDVKFFLRIAGSKGIMEREAFVSELQLHLRLMMLKRPELDVKPRRECCEIKALQDCCYWKKPASDA